ncbi:MAG TPA: CPBP family intramembrane metalloprotease [Candidatus Obscuribacter sp.]|nr:CPBP family intramembrane metalloprotease [Candidatus Obscuribacter sp.]
MDAAHAVSVIVEEGNPARSMLSSNISPRKTLVFIWSLAPWVFLALGLHQFRSIFWSFLLYHGFCLLPAILYNRGHWQKHMHIPTRKDLLVLVFASIGFSAFTFITYSLLSDLLLDRALALESMHERGFKMSWYLPLSLYFLTVNPILEELFWRGVVLNELCDEGQPVFSLPGIWTNVAFAVWHFLVIRLFVAPVFIPLAIGFVLAVGFFMSWMYRRKDTLILPALWHSIVFDLAVIIILTMVLFGPISAEAAPTIVPLLERLR